MPETQIQDPAYIVLEIPSPMADYIRNFRAKFDTARAFMPAEITVTGSSGIGHIEPGQNVSAAAEEMNRIAREFSPFYVAFDKVERFPNTDIYFLSVKDASPFEKLQKAFAESGIRFLPSPFPYRPHCTLKLRCEPSDTELLELFFLEVPQEPFLLSELALYTLPNANSCRLLHKTMLKGE